MENVRTGKRKRRRRKSPRIRLRKCDFTPPVVHGSYASVSWAAVVVKVISAACFLLLVSLSVNQPSLLFRFLPIFLSFDPLCNPNSERPVTCAALH